MTKKEHEAILAAKLEAERERILGKFQDQANYLAEKSIADTLSPDYNCKLDYCRGLSHGYVSAYELVSIWLQEDINKLRKEGLLKMVKRTCPKCGIVRLSADTKDWICEKCGAVVGKELSRPATSGATALK